MEERILTEERIGAFASWLAKEEKSGNTIEKYVRDVRFFAAFASELEVTREVVVAYKGRLIAEGYAPRSVNSMLAAVNCLFSFLGWGDLRVRPLRLQKQMYCQESRELSQNDYFCLVRRAEEMGNERLSLLLQTLCGTGIRVSELPYITVEAVRRGVVTVSLKGKTRTVFIVRRLQRKLIRYAERRRISTGAIFVTRSGRPMDRSNIWAAMKKLCAVAGIEPSKVFPHNLRKLFARTFYGIEKDIAKLADILGHSSINTTRIYIMTTGVEHLRKMERMRLVV